MTGAPKETLESASIRVVRTGRVAPVETSRMLRKIPRLMIDGTEVAKLEGLGATVVSVLPGRHSIAVKTTGGTRKVSVECKPGSQTDLSFRVDLMTGPTLVREGEKHSSLRAQGFSTLLGLGGTVGLLIGRSLGYFTYRESWIPHQLGYPTYEVSGGVDRNLYVTLTMLAGGIVGALLAYGYFRWRKAAE